MCELKEVKDLAGQIQSLLDDAARYGADELSCSCAEFYQTRDCEHSSDIRRFRGFYRRTQGVNLADETAICHRLNQLKYRDTPNIEARKRKEFKVPV